MDGPRSIDLAQRVSSLTQPALLSRIRSIENETPSLTASLLVSFAGDKEEKGLDETEITSKASPHSPGTRGENDREAAGSSVAKLTTSYYMKGIKPKANLGSPLAWMMDFDLDEDEILKSQSAKQCMEDSDAAADLQKLSAENKKEKRQAGSNKRVGSQPPQTRSVGASSFPPPPPPPRKKWKQTGKAEMRSGDRNASAEPKAKPDQEQGSKEVMGPPKPSCAKNLLTKLSEGVSPQGKTAKSGAEQKSEAERDPTFVEDKEAQNQQAPSPHCSDAGRGRTSASPGDKAPKIAAKEVPAAMKHPAEGAKALIAVPEKPSTAKEAAPPVISQQQQQQPDTFLQDFQARMEDADDFMARIDAKNAHITKLMDHADKVRENAICAIRHASKLQVTSITGTSGTLTALSPLHYQYQTYSNHACLLMANRMKDMIISNECHLKAFSKAA